MILLPLMIACTAPGGKTDSDSGGHTGTGDSHTGDSGSDTGDTGTVANTAGTPDPGFGHDGEGFITFDSGRGNDRGRWVTQQADGRILAAGKSNGDFILIRRDPDGAPDTGFGRNGLGAVTTDLGGDDEGKSVRVQPDQRIVLAGISTVGPDGDFGLARYGTDGAPDPFAGGDYVRTDIYAGGHYDEGKSLVIQPDGRYVVGGKGNNGTDDDFALARYLDDGTPDPGFGNLREGVSAGDLDLVDNEGNSVALQSTGDILLAGHTWIGTDGYDNFYEFAVVRYDSAGQPDDLFGVQGVARAPSGQSSTAFSIVVDPADDGFLIAGNSSDGTRNRFAVTRFTDGGQPDPAFNGGDVLVLEIGEVDDVCAGIALQADGKILLAGRAIGTDDSEIAVVRLLPGGQYDPDFGIGGVARLSIGTRPGAYAIALQADGKILLVGDTGNGYDDDIFVARLLAE